MPAKRTRIDEKMPSTDEESEPLKHKKKRYNNNSIPSKQDQSSKKDCRKEMSESPSLSNHCKKVALAKNGQTNDRADESMSFLASLALTDSKDEKCHPDVQKYIKNYLDNRILLANYLYQYFNKQAFGDALPKNMKIFWNPKMTNAAGRCKFLGRVERKTGKVVDKDAESYIELSISILDSPQRLRDTLIHEMCHAAVLVIDGFRGGHGPMWKIWAEKAMKRFPELPLISRCHSYEIETKYKYRCKSCNFEYGRQKSINTVRQRCGKCRGELEFITPDSVNNNDENEANTRKLSDEYRFVYRCSTCNQGYGRQRKSLDVSRSRCGRCKGELKLYVDGELEENVGNPNKYLYKCMNCKMEYPRQKRSIDPSTAKCGRCGDKLKLFVINEMP